MAIVGYGNQGHAHALNLHESGVHVIIGLYKGSKSWKRAEEDGFEVLTTPEAVKKADIVMILVNDEKQSKLYANDIGPFLRKGQYLAFAHGFNIHYGQIVPPSDVNVIMIAPKGPGATVRSQYQEGKGVPCLIAVHQDPGEDSRMSPWRMRKDLAPDGREFSRRPSKKRRRPICSESRRCSAVAFPI